MIYDVVIVGGGTAGLTAAIYTRRAGKSALVIEGEVFGGQISSSPRVENYPGIARISGGEFADALLSQAMDLGAETAFEKVLEIKDGGIKTVVTDSGEYEAKSIILATGAHHRKLGVEREEELSGAGVSYCAVCDGAFFRDKDVAVVGGGDSALQSAIFLSNYCSSVTLIHRRNEFRGERALVDAIAQKSNITTSLESRVTALLGSDSLEGIVLESLSGERSEIAVSGLFISVGQQPDNSAFKNLVELDAGGYIVAGEDCKTSTPGIFAAGDCRTKGLRQLTTAAADGSVAAIAACNI